MAVMSPKLVYAVLGTDHREFNRLVLWLDAVASREDGTAATVFVQHGTSSTPLVAHGAPFLDHDEHHQLLDSAAVIVTCGEPGVVMDAHRLGKTPICVPRDPARGEHSDRRQLRTAALLASRGLVTLADAEPAFEEAVRRGLAVPGPTAGSGEPTVAGERAALILLESLLDLQAKRSDSALGAPSLQPMIPLQRRPAEWTPPASSHLDEQA